MDGNEPIEDFDNYEEEGNTEIFTIKTSEKTPLSYYHSDNITVGKKYDEGKLAWHLLPVEGTEAMLEVMMFGAKKYGDYNWCLGMDWHRLFNASLRHLWRWFLGEDLDKESKLSHLSHASCCILMLSSLVILNRGKDTRPKSNDISDS